MVDSPLKFNILLLDSIRKSLINKFNKLLFSSVLLALTTLLSIPVMAEQYQPLKQISVENNQSFGDFSSHGLSGKNKHSNIVDRLRASEPEKLPVFLQSSYADIIDKVAVGNIDNSIDNNQSNWLVFKRKTNIVALFNKYGDIIWCFDLDEFVTEPKFEIQDVRYDNGNVYFNAACESYSSESGGECSSLYALDTKSKSLLWKTDYLTSNDIFILTDKYVISGYGFTAEPDYLFLFDRKTGKKISKTKLDSAHSYLEIIDNKLHVITYNNYYVFELSE